MDLQKMKQAKRIGKICLNWLSYYKIIQKGIIDYEYHYQGIDLKGDPCVR